MNKLNKIISVAKKLIDLPYNNFNLDNYFPIIYKSFGELGFKNTEQNLPIKLMSGLHKNSGIVTYNQLCSPYRKKNIYIIGKGILFDSGGLDLKRHELNDMTNDKTGMIIALSVANYLKNNVVAYCPITTNFINTSKIVPGDEIKIGKKIVKVINTDAEGRLILAEALSTLSITKSDIIITIATLTGDCAIAIDKKATAIFSPNDDLINKFIKASSEAKELCWRLPLWDYLQEKYYNKSLIKNSVEEIEAGTIEGALFIKQFVKYPENWIHLDIASSAFDDKTKKANGVPIKSLINFIRKIK
jgi:leucyl aminopeptidase